MLSYYWKTAQLLCILISIGCRQCLCRFELFFVVYLDGFFLVCANHSWDKCHFIGLAVYLLRLGVSSALLPIFLFFNLGTGHWTLGLLNAKQTPLSLGPFLVHLIIFILLRFKCTVHILDDSVLSWMSFENVTLVYGFFSHTLDIGF